MESGDDPVASTFEKLRPSLRRARYWQAELPSEGASETWRAAFLLAFKDIDDPRSSEPLETISSPSQLGWRLSAFFTHGVEEHPFSMSSFLENLATNQGQSFVYMALPTDFPAAPWFSLWVLPLPGGPGPARARTKSGEWKDVAGFRWRALSEEEAREIFHLHGRSGE